LKHLKTEIECRQLGPASPFALLRALHPSAALGGFPRAEARAWLAAQPEYHERDTFGAPLVFFADPQNFLAVVCIRGLQWNRQGSRIGAGCGLVARSQWEQEWRELFLKRQSVKAALGL
jgi:menaquinone-specific isochorismate synthase